MISLKKLSETVTTTGQVGVDDLKVLRDLGYVTVLNHRPDHEEPGQATSAELAAEAAALGLRYIWSPVQGMPGQAAVEATAEALDGTPLLMFCRSGMRSTAAWAMAERARGADAGALRDAAAAAGYDLSRLPL